MDASKFCKHCGNSLTTDAQFCSKCGAQIETNSSSPQINKPYSSQEIHQKSPLVVLILGFFLGVFGIHRVNVGKIFAERGLI